MSKGPAGQDDITTVGVIARPPPRPCRKLTLGYIGGAVHQNGTANI